MPSDDLSQRKPGEISSEDREALKKRAADIGAGLDRITARNVGPDAGPKTSGTYAGTGSKGLGDGFRFVIELFVGICFGAFLGWGIDKFFDIAPWGIIIMTLLGFGAGFWNVIKAAQRANNALPPEKRNAPAVKDDRSDD